MRGSLYIFDNFRRGITQQGFKSAQQRESGFSSDMIIGKPDVDSFCSAYKLSTNYGSGATRRAD